MDLNSQHVGHYIKRKTCRFCLGTQLEQVLDLGLVPLAGGFLKKEEIPSEKLYPLDLNFCRSCSLVQVSNVVPAEDLFKNYFYFSSSVKTLIHHFTDFAQEIKNRFQARSVLEIGSNDGVMLKPLAELGLKAIGVDPATNVVNSIAQKNLTVINAFFNEELAKTIRSQHGLFDAIVSCYSYAHIDDMHSVTKGIKYLLNEDGVFIFELYYLGTMMDEMQYDMIYHEHLSYYSLKAIDAFLAQFDMEVFDVKFTPDVRSGATRFYVCHKGRKKVLPAVGQMRQREEEMGYATLETFIAFGQRVERSKKELISLLDQLKSAQKTIIGYGASGRGTTIMNYCGIDGRYLDYVVDDAPAKHGFYTPGTHVPIFPWAKAQADSPEYALLFALSFMDEVMVKRAEFLNKGGKFIIPLPSVRIKSNAETVPVRL